MRNLELKVACDEEGFAEVRMRALRLGASTHLRQRDTYFAVPSGRLKLREIDGGAARRAELIGYSRPNLDGARWSEYYRAELDPEQIAPLVEMMRKTIGVRIMVEKRREVVMHRRTRIHLDDVEGLGHFVELETVVGESDDDAGAADELNEVAEALGLSRYAAIGSSYSDLLAAVARADAPEETT